MPKTHRYGPVFFRQFKIMVDVYRFYTLIRLEQKKIKILNIHKNILIKQCKFKM